MKTTHTIPSTQVLSLAILPSSQTLQPVIPSEKLWEVGSDKFLLQKLIDLIDRAKIVLCVQSFIMDENPVVDALVKAAQRGVAVFVTGATVKLSPPEEEPEFRTESYKKLLEDRFKGRFLFRAADHFHAKFILADPNSNPAGIMLTANLTTNALIKNPELAIPLSKPQVTEFYQLFRYHFWEQATEEHTQLKEFTACKATGKYQPPVATNSLFTLDGARQQNLRDTLLQVIEGAKSHISLSTYNLNPNHPIAQAIIAKANSGVAVKLFFPERVAKIESACKPFLKVGAEVFIQPLLHAKALLVDKDHAFVFSANVEQYGMDQGWETGVRLQEDQVQALIQVFSKWTSEFGRLVSQKSVSEVHGALKVIQNGAIDKRAILETTHKTETRTFTNGKEALDAIAQLKAEHWCKKTHWELDIHFPTPPAKYEKKGELLKGIWEIERPGKDQKPARPALLLDKEADIQSAFTQLDHACLTWNWYEKN